jgi:hypothetical protein
VDRVIGQGRQRACTRFGVGATRAAALALALATADTASAGSGAGRDREHAAWTSLLRRYETTTQTEPLLDVEAVVKTRYSGAARAPEASLCCPTKYDPAFLRAIPDEVL